MDAVGHHGCGCPKVLCEWRLHGSSPKPLPEVGGSQIGLIRGPQWGRPRNPILITNCFPSNKYGKSCVLCFFCKTNMFCLFVFLKIFDFCVGSPIGLLWGPQNETQMSKTSCKLLTIKNNNKYTIVLDYYIYWRIILVWTLLKLASLLGPQWCHQPGTPNIYIYIYIQTMGHHKYS